jgi:predicted permease
MSGWIRPGVRRLFELATGRPRLGEDPVAEEVSAHLDQRVEQLIREGLEPAEARAEALRRFGHPPAAVRTLRRAARRAETRIRFRDRLGAWWADLRGAARRLRRAPGFTLVAIATLALGIGATTAIFSVVNAVLLRPLPYPEPDRLVILWLNNQAEQIERDITSYPTFLDWREAGAFAGMAGFFSRVGTFTGDGDAEQYAGARVTGDFFRVLSVPPQVGRVIGEEQTRAGNDRVVVLSHGLWIGRHGSDPGIVGRSIVVDDQAHEVIGVMPRGFAYPQGADFWLPIPPDGPDWQGLTSSRGSLWLSVIGRLAPAASVEQASAETNAIMARLAEENLTAAGNGVFVEPLQDTIVGNVRPGLLILLGAVGFVLLIACANVANLLLARGIERRRELALRAALGASGGQLARLAVAESAVLAGVGGGVGLLVAMGGTALLVAVSPQDLPRLEHAGVDATVVGFAAGMALLTMLLFGLAPALQARTAFIAAALKESDRAVSGGALSRVRRALVTAEVALALVLLVGAGLLVRSFLALQVVDPGFATERVLSFRVNIGATRYPEPAQVRQFQDALLERVAAVPGVDAATGITTLFLARLPNMGPVTFEGQPPAGPDDPVVSVTNDQAHPGFFEAMRMPVVQGRGFAPTDVAEAPVVVVVNETFVRRFLAGEEPVGRRFTRGNPTDSTAVWQTIIGVVADTRRSGLTEPARPEAYRSTTQGAARSFEVLVRTAGPPLEAVAPIRAALRELDSQIAMAQVRTVEAAIGEAVAARRFVMLLLGGFAGLAVMLAAIGIYGVLAYLVTQRTRELGIRVALGADRATVLGLVLRQSMRQVLPGVVLGVAGALALTRLLQSQLFGVRATDPLTFLGVTGLLVTVAVLASWIPARRAAAVSPMTALGAE